MKDNNNVKEKNIHIQEKAKNTHSIRVLYKKAGEMPELKVIDNVFKLKKAIIKRNLEIKAYQNVFIICNTKEKMKTMPINVIFNMWHVSGDILLVQIDSQKREFENMSIENIIWFTEDLINKSIITNGNNTKVKNTKVKYDITQKMKLLDTNKKSNFEEDLINVLTNIELTLASLIANKK